MIRNVAAIVLLLTIITACTPRPQTSISTPTRTQTQIPVIDTLQPPPSMELPIGDGGLLSGVPCAAPCFFGIRAGETPLDQVVPELGRYGISSCIQDHDSVACNMSVFIGVHSSSPLVDSVGYSPGIPISLGEVIEKYGDPDLIQVFPGDLPEWSHTTILLFWDSIHMRIHLPEKEGEEYVVEKTSPVEWVTFFDETEYANLRKNAFSQPWRGYATYQLDPDA